MDENLKSGLRTTQRVVVDDGRSVRFMGEQLRVYSTPSLIRDIEITCQDYLQKFAEEGEQSVGIHVNVAHVGTTPMGTPIDVEAVIAKVDRRRVTFKVAVRDPVEEIACGEHVRFVVNVEKLASRVQEKLRKLKALANPE